MSWLYWRVRAKNLFGYGPFSNTGVFFTQEILGVGDHSPLPTKFAVHQNYPNPFNPSTQIAYDLPKQSSVRLSVSNLLGQEVRLLYQGVQQPGRYSVAFDASGLSSGVYLYKLEAHPVGAEEESFHSVKKMILMK